MIDLIDRRGGGVAIYVSPSFPLSLPFVFFPFLPFFIYLFCFYLLIFEGFPNRVLVYPDRGGIQGGLCSGST